VEMHPDLYELAKRSNKDGGSCYNIEGTVMNYVMCALENQVLITAFNYLIEQNIEVGSLVFDGLMIYKDSVSPTRLEEILVGLGKRNKIVIGCNITFTNKVMDEKYDNIPVLNSPLKR